MENNWFLYASLAGLLIGINTVMNNYFMNKNINPYIMLILKALFFLFFSLIITIIRSQNGNITLKECIELEMNDVGLMFLGGLFTTLIMFYSFMAVFQVPNTAYSTSIKGSVALTTGFILWTSWDYVSVSWRIREGSAESSGLPYVYVLKTSILLIPIMLLMQGLSEFLKAYKMYHKN